MKIICATVLFVYSIAAFPSDSRPPPPQPAPAPAPGLQHDHDSKLVPFLIGAALGAFLVVKFGKEPKKEPMLKIKLQAGDDR